MDDELKVRLRGIETRLWLIENGLLAILSGAAYLVTEHSPYWPWPEQESEWTRMVAGLVVGLAMYVFARNWCGLAAKRPN
jgi:hypothetical protein